MCCGFLTKHHHAKPLKLREKGWDNYQAPDKSGIPEYNAFADKYCRIAKRKRFRQHFAKQVGAFSEELNPLKHSDFEQAPWGR